jgi:hypothetical protein
MHAKFKVHDECKCSLINWMSTAPLNFLENADDSAYEGSDARLILHSVSCPTALNLFSRTIVPAVSPRRICVFAFDYDGWQQTSYSAPNSF